MQLKRPDVLTEIARDTSNYYVLGYSPTTPATDGSFRRIAVRVKRPGLTVRARRGYVATAASASVAIPAPAGASSSSAEERPASPPARPANAEAAAAPAEAKPVSPRASASAPAFSLRPDSNVRVRELASREGGFAAASSLASQGWDRYQQGDLEGAAGLLGTAGTDPNAHPFKRMKGQTRQHAMRSSGCVISRRRPRRGRKCAALFLNSATCTSTSPTPTCRWKTSAARSTS